MNEDRYLAHYGILGMKWGRRRPTGPDGRIIKNSKSSKKEVFKKEVSKLTDDELRKRINRLRMESEYSSLSNPPTNLEKGRKIVEKTLVASATVVAGMFIREALTKGGKKTFSVIAKALTG